MSDSSKSAYTIPKDTSLPKFPDHTSVKDTGLPKFPEHADLIPIAVVQSVQAEAKKRSAAGGWLSINKRARLN